MVVTFYSFKGGVGRSMALANVAEILADLGYSVLVCDWDLEAPGLEQYLCNDVGEAAEWLANPGIIDLVEEYKRTLFDPKSSPGSAKNADPKEFSLLAGVLLRRPSAYAKLIPRPGRTSGGSIRLLGAGRRDGDESEAAYTKAVRDSNWTEFYDKWAGGAYFEFLRQDLQSEAKVVLIDSRTGVTELGGVSTHQICDVVVLFSAANRQNVKGTEWMADILSNPRLSEQRQNRPLYIIPTAARIEIIAESKLLAPFLTDFKQRFARRVPAALGQPQAFLEKSVIPYAPLFSFEETLVARASESERNPTLFKPYQILADSLIRCGKAMSLLGSHEPGPAPIGNEEPNAVEPPASADAPTPNLVPTGEFFLSWSEGDREYATKLARALKTAGLAVWSDLLDGALRPSEPIATQIQSAVTRSLGGYLILLPREPLTPWLEAEMNLALSRQAEIDGYRVLVLAQGPVEQRPTQLRRFPALPITDGTPEESAQRVIAELLPAKTLVPEALTGTLFDTIKKPTERESRFFFGRDTEIEELTGYVETALNGESRALIITGLAGAGKSTLVRAGMIPLFQRGLFGIKRLPWRIAFAAFHSNADWENILMRAVSEAIDVIAQPTNWLQISSACRALDTPLLVVIDNFEHLDSKDNRVALFGERLRELRASCSAGFFLIITAHPSESDAVTSLVSGAIAPAVYQLPPFRAKGIQQYLTGVARLLGATYEPGLLDVVASDAIALCVTTRTLGSVLQQLMPDEKPGILTHATYRKLGGVEGILTSAAVPLIEKLDAKTGGAARQIIVSLVHGRTGILIERPREDVIRPIRIQKHEDLPALTRVIKVFVDPVKAFLGFEGLPVQLPAVAETLRAFIEEDIVKRSPNGRVRLTTDKMIRTEPVQSWIKKDAERLLLRADLEDAAQRWNELDRSSEFLPPGSLVRKLPQIEWTTQLTYRAAIASGRHRLVKAVIFVLFVAGCAAAIGISTRRGETRYKNTVNELNTTRAALAEEKAEAIRSAALPQRALLIPVLIKQLSSENEEQRRSAPAQLALQGQNAVTPMLAAVREAKGEPGRLVQQGVAEALRQMKAEARLTDVDAQTVVEMLRSDDQSTRTAVADFLKGMQDAQSLQNALGSLEEFVDERKKVSDDASERDVSNAITVIGTWAATLDASIPGTTRQGGLAAEAKTVLKKYRNEFGSDPRWRRTIELIDKLIKAADERAAVQAK